MKIESLAAMNITKVTQFLRTSLRMDYKQLLIDILDGLSEESANQESDIITIKGYKHVTSCFL